MQGFLPILMDYPPCLRSRCVIVPAKGSPQPSEDRVKIDRSRAARTVRRDCLLRFLNRCPQARVLGLKPLNLFDMHVLATRGRLGHAEISAAPRLSRLVAPTAILSLFPHAKKLLFRATFERPNAW